MNQLHNDQTSEFANPGLCLDFVSVLPEKDDLSGVLIEPVRKFMSRESKQVRAQLVRIGFELAKGSASANGSNSAVTDPAVSDERLVECLAYLVEAIHAGSLVIDDIQDNSEIRRGQPALHLQIGVPCAINAANWLYFWPTELIRQQNLPPAIELDLYRLFHQTMIRAHHGQAMDLGHDMTQIGQIEARKISLAAIELKTGELMAMCAEFGAIAGQADSDQRAHLATAGRRFGIALQMFNDIGEVVTTDHGVNCDSALTRPSWIWAVAADELGPEEFKQFQETLRHTGKGREPGSRVLQVISARAIQLARTEMESTLNLVTNLTGAQENIASVNAISAIKKLAVKVMKAYA